MPENIICEYYNVLIYKLEYILYVIYPWTLIQYFYEIK